MVSIGLTHKFEAALIYACRLHRDQLRADGKTPYVRPSNERLLRSFWKVVEMKMKRSLLCCMMRSKTKAANVPGR